jgi:cation:H+ antiporter
MLLVDLGWFLGGLALLLLGGDSLVKGVSGIAQKAGMPPFRAGLFLLAFATSLPELAVNARAFAAGHVDLALGNAVGSNLANIGLTLGIAALAAPLVVTMRLAAVEMVLLLVATGAVLFFGLDGTIARWEGVVLLAGFAALLVLVVRRAAEEGGDVARELSDYAQAPTGVAQNLVRLGIGAAVLYFGAGFVVGAAPALGRAFGFGDLLTGLLPVAIGTALPEIVVAVMAARAGQANVVAGHVLGASLFNLLAVVGAMALARPLPLPASFITFELPAAMAFVLVLYPILGGDLRVNRREGGVLVAMFVAWVAYELFTAWS